MLPYVTVYTSDIDENIDVNRTHKQPEEELHDLNDTFA